MSTTTTSSENALTTPESTRRALLPKLGSALAIFPLGVWTVLHLWNNLYAWRGAEVWQQRVASPRHPVAEVITSTVVLMPLLLHTVWGLRRVKLMQPNLHRYPTFDNFKYVLQRLSALGLLGFLIAHVWLARFKPMVEHGRHESFQDLAWHMRNHTPTLIVYCLGVLGIAYHLANGIATAGMTFGFAASPRAARRMSVVSIVAFVVMLAMGFGAIYALWDQGGAAAAEAVAPGRGLAPSPPAL